MRALSTSDVRKLAKRYETWCVSAVLGMHPVAGVEAGDALRLRNHLKAAERELIQLGVRRGDSRELLAGSLPEEVNDPGSEVFHKGGLAVFAAPGLNRSFRISVETPDLVTVSRRFHLTPLLAELGNRRRFLVLAVTRGFAALYAAGERDFAEIDVQGLPRSMDEALRYDDRERTLLSHSASRVGAGSVVAAFHGQGARVDQLSKDTARYLRMIDGAIAPVVKDRPVVLAGSREVVAAYRKVASHPTYDSVVLGNPKTIPSDDLHARAREIADADSGASLKSLFAEVDNQIGTGRASIDPGVVIEAAASGRVASIVLAADAHRWGRPDGDGHSITSHDDREPGDHDLLDEAAVRAWMTGASVHVVAPDDLPDGVRVAAVFRY